MLRRLRFLMLLILVLLLRIILSPFDVSLGVKEAISISILAPLIGLILLFFFEVYQDENKDFGFEEYVEGTVVVCFGTIPLGLWLYAIMLTGLLAGWVSHISGEHW